MMRSKRTLEEIKSAHRGQIVSGSEALHLKGGDEITCFTHEGKCYCMMIADCGDEGIQVIFLDYCL